MKKKFTLIIFAVLAILKLQAQDYFIGFAGTGDTTSVTAVQVENLTSGTTLTLNGGDILHLISTVGIGEPLKNAGTMQVYPNPMVGQSVLTFCTPENGDALICIVDLSGKTVYQRKRILSSGTHSFRISGIKQGLYLVKVTGGNYSYTSKLISLNNIKSNVSIDYVSSLKNTPGNQLKSTAATIDMPYTEGDRLLFKSTTGSFSTIVTDVPTADETITFTFAKCTDADNNNYSTVQIGTQVWMVENLKSTRFNDGTAIPLVDTNSVWGNLSTPGYGWYDNDVSNKDTYGAIYNWYAVNTDKLAPAGWHVPSDTEWELLINYLGGYDVAGGKLKSTGTTEAGNSLWASPNTGATNESGFSALPGGYRYSNTGDYGALGRAAGWWPLNGYNDTETMNHGLGFDYESFWGNPDDPKSGFNVRCLKGEYSELPIVNTDPVDILTESTASYAGYIRSDGGSLVTAYGICYSTSPSPTLLNSNYTTDGTGKGGFSGILSGLTPLATYYLRTYATNSLGTAYGNEISFTPFNYAGIYRNDGYFKHPTASSSRTLYADKTITTVDRNTCELGLADLADPTTPAYFIRVMVLDETEVVNGKTVNKVVISNVYTAPAVLEQLDIADDLITFEQGVTFNYYDPAAKKFVLRYHYHNGAAWREIEEILTKRSPTDPPDPQLVLSTTTDVKTVMGIDLPADQVVDMRLFIVSKSTNAIISNQNRGKANEAYTDFIHLPDGEYLIGVEIDSTANFGDLNKPINLSFLLGLYQQEPNQTLSFPNVITNAYVGRTYLAVVTKTGSDFTIKSEISYVPYPNILLTTTTDVKTVMGIDLPSEQVVDMRMLIVSKSTDAIVAIQNKWSASEQYNDLVHLPDGEYFIGVDIDSTANFGELNKPINLSFELLFSQPGSTDQTLSYPDIITNEYTGNHYRTYLATVVKVGSVYTIEKTVTYWADTSTGNADLAGTWSGYDASPVYPSQVVSTFTSGKLEFTGIGRGWTQDAWGEVITKEYPITIHFNYGNGTVVIPSQIIMETTYGGSPQKPYYIKGIGTFDLTGPYPIMSIHYDFIQGTATIAQYFGLPYFTLDISLAPGKKTAISNGLNGSVFPIHPKH